MIEGIPPSMIYTAIAVVATNITTNWVTIAWLKSDLKKHEDMSAKSTKDRETQARDVKNQLLKLQMRAGTIMDREAVERVVHHEIAPLAVSLSKLTSKMDMVSEAVDKMLTQIAVMNALSKERNTRSHTQRLED